MQRTFVSGGRRRGERCRRRMELELPLFWEYLVPVVPRLETLEQPWAMALYNLVGSEKNL